MKRSFAGARISALLLVGCAGGGTSALVPGSSGGSPGGAVPTEFQQELASGLVQPACGAPAAGEARCFAELLTSAGRAAALARGTLRTEASTSVSGYGPTQLQAAYGITSAAASDGAGKTVAIVDAYNDPNAASDLATYRSYFGLPACTTASGCLKIVGQTGSTTKLPANNASWDEEISLDLDMVSANCPKCNILLVEATSSSMANLAAAVAEAAKLGATAISNSYGGSESSSETEYASDYNQTASGIVVTASNGDDGYGVYVPAAYNTVTAVGGTSLDTASNARGWSETVWSGTGSGCSAYIAKPSWQHDSGCSNRTVGDVAYDANPDTGVAVYDSVDYEGYVGWLVFGGTSVASPSIASIYALSGVTKGADGDAAAELSYANSADLWDVTSGSNGSCSVAYLCNGEVGYDAPTGNGTPNGTGAF